LKKTAEIEYNSSLENESESYYEEELENIDLGNISTEILNMNNIILNSKYDNQIRFKLDEPKYNQQENFEYDYSLEGENENFHTSKFSNYISYHGSELKNKSKSTELNNIKIINLYGHKANVLCISIINDNLIVSGSEDKSIKIWDIKKLLCLKTLHGHSDKVLALVKLSEDKICSSSSDSKIKIWDIKSGICLKTFGDHRNWVISILAFSKDILISGDAEGNLIFWDLIILKSLKNLNAHPNHWINSISKLNNILFASCSGDFTIKLWNITNYECFKVLKHESIVWGIVNFSENILSQSLENDYENMELDYNFILSCSSDGFLRKWNLCNFTYENFEGELNVLKSISLLGKNKLISCGWDGYLKIWDIQNKIFIRKLNNNCITNECFVNGVSVINESTIATFDEDNCIKIWLNIS